MTNALMTTDVNASTSAVPPGVAPRVPQAGKSTALPALSIVSNSRLLREGIGILLAPYLAFIPVGQYPADPCGTGDALRGVPPAGNHFALLDSSIGLERCAAWTRFWREASRPPRVILLEVPDDVETIVRSIELGICAYTLAGASPEEVAAAIRLANEGGAICSPEVTARLFARLAQHQAHQQTGKGAWRPGERRNDPAGDPAGDLPGAGTGSRQAAYELRLLLTDREYEVLQHVVAGRSNREIAAALTIEVRTVKQHVHNIFGKLQLQNRVQAVARAAGEGWFRF